MAQSKFVASKFINLLLILSFLIIMVSMAESKKLGIGFGKINAASVSCDVIHGTQAGDTCSLVAEEASLSLDSFLAINPNINCETIFVGQWLCVDGSLSSP